MYRTLRNLIADESGATAIEYGLIAALVSVAIVASLGLVRTGLTGIFGTISTALTGASATASGG